MNLDKTVKKKRPLKQYTFGEEVFNSVTHGVGTVLSLVGGSVLVTLAVLYGQAIDVVACVVYSISLVMLYTMSTLYHAFPFPRAKFVFRVFDHSSVFLLIAGTYTPFMLISLRGTQKGLVIFVLLWIATTIGIILNAISVDKFAKLSLILYVLMGWSIVFAMGDVTANLTFGGMIFLIIGGVSYTVGIIFYVIKKVKYFHSIWHLFVMCGSIMHYLCIILFVIPKPAFTM